MIQIINDFAVDKCSHFLALPTWYEYVHPANDCSVVKIDSIGDLWLIVAAIIEILLRVAALFAVGFVIYGGIQYLTSQAEPDKLTKARQTIINALIGLGIAVLASVMINFIAGSISK